ncbi:MAG: hypothetical protein ACTSWU_00955 [Candidatus Thorarchaeota archaeon]
MTTTRTQEALETGLLISDTITDTGLEFIQNLDPDLFKTILKRRGIKSKDFNKTLEIRRRVKRRAKRRNN